MFTFCLSSDELSKAKFSFRDETYIEDISPKLESNIKTKHILYVDTNLAFLIEMKLVKDYSKCIPLAL